MDSRSVGILGGGQLGRMMVEAANRLNIKTVILDAENAPAKQINAQNRHVTGSFNDAQSIQELARRCDVLTAEIEHINTNAVEEVLRQDSDGRDGEASRQAELQFHPHWGTIRTIQDKYAQKEHLGRFHVPTAESLALASNNVDEASRIIGLLGLPCMLKARTQAYDGRGNHPVKVTGDIPVALEALRKHPLYAERWVPFTSELAVMVVKTALGTTDDDEELWRTGTLAYPVVETVHENSICKLVYAPARGVDPNTVRRAEVMARQAVASFQGLGIFGVEMFLLENGELLVNEIAPRPHNSGHFTIEACPISQFEAHLRAILGLPFPVRDETVPSRTRSTPGTEINTPDTHAIMLNMLGGPHPTSHLELAREALEIPGASVHLYGKGEARPGRKMGHITILAGSTVTCEARLASLLEGAARASSAVGRGPSPHAPHGKQTRSLEGGRQPVSQALAAYEAETRSRDEGKPPVGVTMGSDSDLPALKPGLETLRQLGIAFEVTVTSAHRTPGRMLQYAQAAATRGVKVIIAAAGGAAHLPGMLASSTPLPVIGVPIKGSTLDGMDSLLSIVQMPRGVPVATVAINNSTNAALLAARILGASDPVVRGRLEQYATDMERTVMDKVRRLDEQGWDRYDVGS